MTAQRDFAISNRNAENPETADPNVQPSRTRESSTAPLAPVVSLTERVLRRAATTPPLERENPPGLPRPRFRHPWAEDFPSPRCALADARKGAETYGPLYWLAAAVPLSAYLVFGAPFYLLTQRPALFWAAVTVTTVCWLIASV